MTKISRFKSDESGSMSVFSLFIFTTSLIIAGLAIDVSNLYAARTRLQVAADSAAHAALYMRETRSETEAKAAALALVSNTMRQNLYGMVLTSDDIEFGDWDEDTLSFTPRSGSRTAVRIATRQIADRNNAVGNYLLKLVGVPTFNVNTPSVFVTHQPPCLREGMVAQELVDMQSNNYFYAGFCIHANGHVEMNQNNIFESGVHISMPDETELNLPGRTPTNMTEGNNTGVNRALQEGVYNIRILRKLPTIINSLSDADYDYVPDYITSGFPVRLGGGQDVKADYQSKQPRKQMLAKNDNANGGNGNGGNGNGGNGGNGGGGNNGLSPDDFTQGRVHTYSCTGNSSLTMNGGTYSSFVLVTNCDITFAQGVVLQDVAIATTSTSDQSIKSPSGFVIGKDDDCSPGGGAQVITMGGFKAAAKMELHGGQIIALGDVDFAAQGVGGNGASIISGGTIDARSNNEMGFCGGSGTEGHFVADYFRLAA